MSSLRKLRILLQQHLLWGRRGLHGASFHRSDYPGSDMDQFRYRFRIKGTSIHYFRTEGRGWDQKLIVLEAAQILWYKLEPNVDEGAVVPKAQKIEVIYGCPLHLINKDDQ